MFAHPLPISPLFHRFIITNTVKKRSLIDIDIIQSIVDSPIARIDANGAIVLSDEPDILNARITFANGCVANTTASRAGIKTERRMHIFQHDTYVSVDFRDMKLKIHRKRHSEKGKDADSLLNIDIEERHYQDGDALLLQSDAFLQPILMNSPLAVSGEDGKRALETAIKITRMVHDNETLSREDSPEALVTA